MDEEKNQLTEVDQLTEAELDKVVGGSVISGTTTNVKLGSKTEMVLQPTNSHQEAPGGGLTMLCEELKRLMS